MINIEEQRKLLVVISEKIPKRMVVYAIGGTAMMLLGLKAETKDIDLIFQSEKDRQLFKQIAHSLGYKETDARVVYSNRKDIPILIRLEQAHIDLFLPNVLGVKFSNEMMKRAEQIHEFGYNLIIRPADIHDIIIMKSATSRIKDEEDILTLLQNKNIDWNILIGEAENQIKLGNEKAVLNLGYLLKKLSSKGKFFVPSEVLDSLWKTLKKQSKEKSKNDILKL